MSKKRNTTHLVLPPKTKQKAQVAAASRGLSLAEYVTALIEADCAKTGISALLSKMEVTHDVE